MGEKVRWRWIGRYRDTHVQVKLLCPVRTRAGRPEKPADATVAEANIGPSGEITALAVGFGHLVPEDTITVQRRVETRHGMLAYEFPVAGIASWLCLKADAIMRRDKAKDAYDVVWLTDALGPDQAAGKIAASPLLAGRSSAEVIAQLSRLIDDQFRDIESAGSIMYAEFLEAQPADAELRHAHGAIAALGEELRKRGIGPAA